MSVLLPYFSVHVIYSSHHLIPLNLFPNVKGNMCVISSTSIPCCPPLSSVPLASCNLGLFAVRFTPATRLFYHLSNLIRLSVRLLYSLYLIVRGWGEKNDFFVCQLCHYHKYAADQGSVPETSSSIRLLTALRSDGLIFEGFLGGGYAAISWPSFNMCHGFSH